MMNFVILVNKDVPLEISMSDVDDILMDIRKFIFDQISNKKISVISIGVDIDNENDKEN